MGLGYDDVAAVHPSVIYVSVSGFGNSGSPYDDWPAYASIAEAMSGIYDYVLVGDETPRPNPVGALGDISSALFATIGILTALRHRDATGEGQHIDVAMYDATVAMTDIVTNFGLARHRTGSTSRRTLILDPFRAADGWFVVQLVPRAPARTDLAELVGHPEWPDRPAPRDACAAGPTHVDDMLRPAIEAWATDLTKLEACEQLSAPPASPRRRSRPRRRSCATPTSQQRNMLVEMERTDGGERPVLIPGNPVKLSKVAEGPESRMPWVGEHTRSVLHEELGLDDAAIDALVADGVVTG